MSINVIFCFVLLLALNSSVDSIKFCKAFRENNDKISYVLRSDIPKEPNIKYVTGYNFIINGNKWLAKFKDDSKSKPEMEFIANESQSTPFFSDDYQMAVWLWFKGKTRIMATLFRKNNWKSLTFGWTENELDLYKLDHYKYNKKLSLDMPLILSSNVEKPKIIFQENVDKLNLRSSQTFVLIYQGSSGQPLTVKRFEIDYIIEDGKITGKVSDKTPDHLNGLKELITEYELIGVIPQWTHYNSKYSFVYLFKDQIKIRWCVSDGERLDKNWCQTNPTILIDCTSTEKPTTTSLRPSVSPSISPSINPTVSPIVSPSISPTVSPNSNQTQVTEKDGENYALIAMIVTIVVVIIILFGIAIYLCRYFRKEATTQSSTQSTLPTKQISIQSSAGANPSTQSSKKKVSSISSNFGSKK